MRPLYIYLGIPALARIPVSVRYWRRASAVPGLSLAGGVTQSSPGSGLVESPGQQASLPPPPTKGGRVGFQPEPGPWSAASVSQVVSGQSHSQP